MAAPNQSIAPSTQVIYRSTTGAFDITTLGAPCREIVVAVAGTITVVNLDTTSSGAGVAFVGLVLTGQFTDLTLADGCEVWILL